MKSSNARRGTMLVEFALTLAVWTVACAGLVTLGRIALWRHRAHRLARYGTLLQSSGRLSDSVVRDELDNYASVLFANSPSNVRIETGRFLETSSSAFYRLLKTRVVVSMSKQSQPIVETVVCQQEAPQP